MNVTVGVIGSGKLAVALVPYLLAKGVSVSGIWGRNSDATQRIAAANSVCFTSDLQALVERSRIIVLAVRDDALETVAGRLENFSLSGRVVIHASGCRGLDALEPISLAGGIVACVHPLMSLIWNAGQPNPLAHAPCGLACRDRRWKRLLSAWLIRAGNPCFPLDNGDRPLYHAAAVLACAGLSQLFSTASGVLAKGLGIPVPDARRMLMPLARKTLDVCGGPDPVSCTGPWTRGDGQTVSMHIAALKQNDTKAAILYEALMNSAIENS